MKRVFVIVLLLYVCVSTTANAQRSLNDVAISLDAENRSLSEVLHAIEEKSGFAFSYNPKKISVQQKITYHATNEKLTKVLHDLSAESGLTFELIENQIILKPDKRAAKTESQVSTLSGTIKDANSGEALIGAAILVKELQTGAVTNAFGFYSITIPKGTYTIMSSFLGFKNVSKVVDLTGSVQEDILLEEEPPVILEEVVVNSTPSEIAQIQTSSFNIPASAVEERPAFFGELDVVKSLESVPGVKFHSDGSSFYYIRGGYRDQNLILIDDAPVFNPSHMLGVFSTIIPDAVNDITLYKGDMPASLGGRLSSVLDIHTKKGNDHHFQAWGSAGLTSTKIGIEGPIKKNASSYLLSGRVSTLKWFFQLADKNITQFNFSDLTGKVNIRFNPANRLFFSFYTSGDNYFSSNNGIAWFNTAATLQWNHLFSDRLFMNTTIATGGYDYFLYTDVQNDTKWNSRITNGNLKSDFSYFINPDNEITFGTAISGYGFNPGNLQSKLDISSLPSLSVRNSAEFVLYANHEVRLGSKLGFNYGIRLSSWSNAGESFEYIFDENDEPVDTLYFAKGDRYKSFGKAEPRFTVNYAIDDNISVKASYSRNVQHVHLISNSVSPFTALDVWLPSSFNIKPQLADQVTVGYYQTLPGNNISLSGEAFYKKMFNQIDYDAHAELLLNPMLERELLFGSATAYGLELTAKKDQGRLRGWVGYTYSRAKRKFADINDGEAYNAFYDRPHQVNITTHFGISTRWQLGTNFTYSSGAPYSSPVGFYSYNGEEIPVYGAKNNARLPDYHRLDISATYQLNKNPANKFIHNLTFQVFNAYARKNILFVNYNKTETEDGSLKVPSDQTSPRVTSQFYLFRFVPSISYNFRWL